VKTILVTAKDIRHQGGYYEFVSMLLNRQSDQGNLDYFRVGRLVDSSSVLGKVFSIPNDQLRLMWRLHSGDYSCILFNTSMDQSAFIRDALLIMSATSSGPLRIVVQVHGWQDPFVETIPKRRLLRSLFARSFLRAYYIVVLSSRFRDQLVEMGVEASRIRVGKSMFDGKIFERREPDRKGRPKQLLFLSRLAKEKGVHELLVAFARIHVRYPDVRLVIAGDGPERERLRERATELGVADSVRFPGYVRGKHKADLLLESDIFLLPTVYGEGMPIAMLEGMAAGMPVIVTRAGAMGELLADADHGALLDSNSSEDIERAVADLLGDPERVREIAVRNRSMAWSQFEADLVSRRIVGLCRE